MSKKSAGLRYRSAISGQFVTKSKASRSIRTTLSEKIGGGSTHGSHRSAISGRFVTNGYAKRHPKLTIKDS